MRGSIDHNGSLFSYVSLAERIPKRCPLCKIREVVNATLVMLYDDFERLYAGDGRPSIAPERLLRASLIQTLFSIRSERQLMADAVYNLLFRWSPDQVRDVAWHRRSGVGGDGILEEPRPAVQQRAVLADLGRMLQPVER